MKKRESQVALAYRLSRKGSSRSVFGPGVRICGPFGVTTLKVHGMSLSSKKKIKWVKPKGKEQTKKVGKHRGKKKRRLELREVSSSSCVPSGGLSSSFGGIVDLP